ncbi:MAG TPA: (d)CMP kinase [Solirubrobacteraceae bacterium]|jgi:cytidylate kinase|nr:(d)CMP kinase [Solirubrobacteraceae bacterium]
MVVAIDGPAGAGKSSVARAVAQQLGFTYLDSGSMYRAVALAALRAGADPAQVAPRVVIDVGERVLLDGGDVTAEIRTPEVTEAASKAASLPEVRSAMVAQQRRLMSDGDWVAEGRDIGTVVAPDAAVKVFLTASPEARAARRAAELGGDAATVLAEQVIRDQRDSEREHSPLRAADDAVTIDTTELSFDEAVDRVVSLVEAARSQS